MNKLKKPPYARELVQQGGCVWLYFGAHAAWERAQTQRALGWCNVLVLPAGEQPGALDWSCVAGLSVVAVELDATSAELRQALVRSLAVYGARDAYLIAHSRRSADCVLWNCQLLRKAEAA